MNKKILVIESDRHLADSIADILELESYEVILAYDGTSGIEQVKEHIPDLIVCEIQTPTINGYDVLREIREQPEAVAIPLMFLTNGKFLETGRGTNRFFDAPGFLMAVESKLKRKQQLDEAAEKTEINTESKDNK